MIEQVTTTLEKHNQDYVLTYYCLQCSKKYTTRSRDLNGIMALLSTGSINHESLCENMTTREVTK